MSTSTEAPAKALLDLKVGDEVVIEANRHYGHGVGHQTQTVKVTRVGRLYFYVRLQGYREEFGFYRSNGLEKVADSSRSRRAHLPEDWRLKVRRRTVLARIQGHGFRNFGFWSQSTETLEKIADLLDADKAAREKSA